MPHRKFPWKWCGAKDSSKKNVKTNSSRERIEGMTAATSTPFWSSMLHQRFFGANREVDEGKIDTIFYSDSFVFVRFAINLWLWAFWLSLRPLLLSRFHADCPGGITQVWGSEKGSHFSPVRRRWVEQKIAWREASRISVCLNVNEYLQEKAYSPQAWAMTYCSFKSSADFQEKSKRRRRPEEKSIMNVQRQMDF